MAWLVIDKYSSEMWHENPDKSKFVLLWESSKKSYQILCIYTFTVTFWIELSQLLWNAFCYCLLRFWKRAFYVTPFSDLRKGSKATAIAWKGAETINSKMHECYLVLLSSFFLNFLLCYVVFVAVSSSGLDSSYLKYFGVTDTYMEVRIYTERQTLI